MEGGREGAAVQPALSSLPAGTDAQGVELALAGMEVGIFEWDTPTGAHRYSDRCKTLWGFRSDEPVTPALLLARVHPEDMHAAQRMLRATDRYNIELRVVLPDGSVRWVQVAAGTAPAGSGTARGWGAMRDITRRREAEQKLQRQSSQLRKFVESAPVSIAFLDHSMRYVAASERYAQQRHFTPAELIGQNAYAALPHMPRHWRNRHQRILAGATERCESEPFVLPDGTREWVRWEMRPWYVTGSQVGGIILFAEINTQSIKEQQLLRDSQARLELAIHAGQLGVFDYDFAKKCATWDERMRRLWELTPGEPVTAERFLARIHPGDREKVDNELREASHAGDGAIFKSEHRIIATDGSVRWISGFGRVCRGEHVHLVGVARDITERKRTELALEESAAELRRMDERKNVYLATLSHELRNPLAPIRTAAHLLASPQLTPEQLRWVSDVIRRQTAQMASLLDDLLEITRLSRGKLQLRKVHVPLSDIVQSALESVQPLIDKKGHRLLIRLPEPPLVVHADPLRMSQVLSNILTNAAKYTDPGGQIALTAGAEEDNIVICVKDDGIGIARDSIDKIFTMFWQGGPSGQGGIGIGLAFAAAIVQLHGGTVEAHSDGPGCGSELRVRLPRASKDVAPAAVSAPAVLQRNIPGAPPSSLSDG
jgi:PAS domain S-box-containing protein